MTSKNLSHFELVIVDQKGHWIRSRGATQKTEGVTCFTGVTLPSDELLIPGKVSVIVIERDLDGLNVVASAHAEAFFSKSEYLHSILRLNRVFLNYLFLNRHFLFTLSLLTRVSTPAIPSVLVCLHIEISLFPFLFLPLLFTMIFILQFQKGALTWSSRNSKSPTLNRRSSQFITPDLRER